MCALLATGPTSPIKFTSQEMPKSVPALGATTAAHHDSLVGSLFGLDLQPGFVFISHDGNGSETRFAEVEAGIVGGHNFQLVIATPVYPVNRFAVVGLHWAEVTHVDSFGRHVVFFPSKKSATAQYSL